MGYYASPEALAANPPETWRVERVQSGSRAVWRLYIDDSENYVQQFDTKTFALRERDNADSFTRRAVEQERLWYAGTTPSGWKTYSECLAERERIAQRSVSVLGSNPNYRAEQWP